MKARRAQTGVWPAIGLSLARLLALVVPAGWLLAAGRAAAPVLYMCLPRVRRDLLDNAGHILGARSTAAQRRALAIGVLRSFSRFALEILTSHRGLPIDERLFEGMAGREHYVRACEAGRGIIGVTLHIGNYEVGPMLLARLQPDVAIVYHRDPVGMFEKVRSDRRSEHGIIEIPIDRRPLFGVEVLSVLRRRGMVLLAADIGFDVLGEGDLYPFLDGRAPFLTWPARLSLSSRAPILPCFIVRDDGRYRLEIAEPVFPDKAGDVEGIMARLLPVFEDVLRHYPDQWLILHRYWPEPARGKTA